MKAATINELKQELTHINPAQLVELCLRLARFKKENKELLTYLLFEAHDTAAYITAVKQELVLQFEEVNTSNMYFVKKTLRKILRTANKYIRYSGLATVEVEVLIDFCAGMKALGIALHKYPVLTNLWNGVLKKINTTLATLHEDLQYDYRRQIEALG